MKMLGIIFSNIYDNQLGRLTEHRAMASVPYGGRYRLIDFVLTNMVSSSITSVGVITKSNYQSLMDHLGNGSEWDLDRKTDGLYILPPFSSGQTTVYKGKLEALQGAVNFLEHAMPDYVVLSDTNIVMRIDYRDMLKAHIKSGADITMLTKNCSELDEDVIRDTIVRCDESGRINDVRILPTDADKEGDKMGLGVYIISKKLLMKIIDDSRSYGLTNFERDCIQRSKDIINIRSYNHEGSIVVIDNLNNYYKGNMALLDTKINRELFVKNGPVYTKTRDEVPAKYDEYAVVKNSLIADGCVVNGTVENSILFRGVKVKKGAKITNSIVMQDTVIGKDATIANAILDKEVKISDNKMIVGDKQYPTILAKGVTI
ncbi:MAG: glucose-1-phosphate adenylyltransferase subunit GlgD [Clostridia bacterium]|nr:glucose-1-phosphate adenylyltransferase subunit GlgD [Clostridia bacterium]